jgi:hypothetical protein
MDCRVNEMGEHHFGLRQTQKNADAVSSKGFNTVSNDATVSARNIPFELGNT